MKYLILILLSFNSYADVKIEIENTVNGKKYGAEFETQAEADLWKAKNIANDSWGKKERWEKYKDQTNCITLEYVYMEIPDYSIPYPNPAPSDYVHPTKQVVDHQRCRIPVDYTITETDITLEVQAKKDKKIADDLLEEDIKSKIKNKSAKLDDLIEYIRIKEGL